MLSREGISTWLLDQVEATNVDLKGVRIKDVLKYERSDTVKFYSKDRKVVEARREFVENLVHHRVQLYAIVITSSGTPRGEPLGIITPWDFLEPKYW